MATSKLIDERLVGAAFAVLAVVGFLATWRATGPSAWENSPDALTWIPPLVIASALFAIGHHRRGRFFSAALCLLTIGFWVYCCIANGGPIGCYQRDGLVWLIPTPMLVLCAVECLIVALWLIPQRVH